MLIVTRKSNEKIRLSNGVVISIESLTASRVRIGIECPKHIGITRSNPCVVCNRPSFDFYLGYGDIPFCGDGKCADRIRSDEAERVKMNGKPN